MDVKSTFLNGIIKDEVFVKQTMGLKILHVLIMFTDFPNCMVSNMIQKLGMRDVVYFLLQNVIQWWKIDTTLIIQRSGAYILIVKIYVDDIMF